jgi:hypothetical protein
LVQRRDHDDRRLRRRLCQGSENPGPDLLLQRHGNRRLRGRRSDVWQQPIDRNARFGILAKLLPQRRLRRSRQEIEPQIGRPYGIRFLHDQLPAQLIPGSGAGERERNHQAHEAEDGGFDSRQSRANDIRLLPEASPAPSLSDCQHQKHAGKETQDQ